MGADFCGIVRYVLADDDLCCRAEQPVLYIGKIDIDSVSMAVALTVGIYPLIKMLEKL